jgi:hypothetical protein
MDGFAQCDGSFINLLGGIIYAFPVVEANVTSWSGKNALPLRIKHNHTEGYRSASGPDGFLCSNDGLWREEAGQNFNGS